MTLSTYSDIACGYCTLGRHGLDTHQKGHRIRRQIDCQGLTAVSFLVWTVHDQQRAQVPGAPVPRDPHVLKLPGPRLGHSVIRWGVWLPTRGIPVLSRIVMPLALQGSRLFVSVSAGNYA